MSGFLSFLTMAHYNRHLWHWPPQKWASFDIFKKQIILVLWSAADIMCILAGLLFEKCKALEVLHPYINHVLERYKFGPEMSARLPLAFSPCQTCAAATGGVGRTPECSSLLCGECVSQQMGRQAGRSNGSSYSSGVFSTELPISSSPFKTGHWVI